MALIAERWERDSLPSTMKDAKRMQLHRTLVLVLCACCLAAQAADSIKNDWPTYNGDYTGRRFSGLTQITQLNAEHLRAQWVFHTRTPGVLEATPVVVDGIMYFTGSNDAFALNAQTRTGVVAFTRVRFPGASSMTRRATSTAAWPYRVRACTWKPTMHICLCLDSRSGGLLWDVAYADWNKNYGATGAPTHSQR